MLLYTDVVSGDEMISDGFKLIEVDNFAYEVDCKVGLSMYYPIV